MGFHRNNSRTRRAHFRRRRGLLFFDTGRRRLRHGTGRRRSLLFFDTRRRRRLRHDAGRRRSLLGHARVHRVDLGFGGQVRGVGKSPKQLHSDK